MRGGVELPEKAKKVLDDLTMQRDLALDQMQALGNRLRMLPDDAAELRERLTAEQSKFRDRHQVYSQVVSRCNQFCMELRLAPGAVLESHPPLKDFKVKGSLPAACEAARKQIAEVQHEIARIRRLPLTRESQLAAIRARFESLSAWAAPKIGFDAKGGADLRYVEDLATMPQVMSLMVYILGAETVAAAFARDLPDECDESITPQERAATVEKLSSALLKLEREEEVIISCAHTDGTEILRRPTANPLAVLRLQIVAATEASAAA
jgi:hypothetical protein